MTTAEESLKSRCHPSCRTCTIECLLLEKLGVNGLGLVELKANSHDPLIPFSCTACDSCAVVCNRKLDPGELMHSWREKNYFHNGFFPAALSSRLADQPENIYALYRRTYPGMSTIPKPVSAETVFFPGCAMSAYTPDHAQAAFDTVLSRYPDAGWLDSCCYDLLGKLGMNDRYHRAQQSLASVLRQRGIQRIITACPTCHYRLIQDLPETQVISIYQLLADGLQRGPVLPARYAVHDSCADRMSQVLGKAIRKLLPETQKLKHEGKRSLCCGAGNGVNITDPKLANEFAERRWSEVKASGAEILVTYCTECAIQLARTSSNLPVVHIFALVFGLYPDYRRIATRIQKLKGKTDVKTGLNSSILGD